MQIDKTQTNKAARELISAATQIIFEWREGYLGDDEPFEQLQAAIVAIEGKAWPKIRRPIAYRREREIDLLYPEREAWRGKAFNRAAKV